MTGLPLICGLKPDTLDPDVNYTTQWIAPGGQIINSTEGQFIFTESMVSIYSRALPGTILIVTNLPRCWYVHL